MLKFFLYPSLLFITLVFTACAHKSYKVPKNCDNLILLRGYDGANYKLNLLEYLDESNSIDLIQFYQSDAISEVLYSCEYKKTLITFAYKNKNDRNHGYEILSLDGSSEEFIADDYPSTLDYYKDGVIIGTDLMQKIKYEKSFGDSPHQVDDFEYITYSHYITFKDIFEHKSFNPLLSYKIRLGDERIIKNDTMYGYGQSNGDMSITVEYQVNLTNGFRKKTNTVVYSNKPIILDSDTKQRYFFKNVERNLHQHSKQEIEKFRSQLTSDVDKWQYTIRTLHVNAIYKNNEPTPELMWESNNTVYDYFVKEDDVYLFDSQNNIIKYSPLSNTKKIYPYPFEKRYKLATFLNDKFVFILHTDRRDENKEDIVEIVITDKNFHPISKYFRLEGFEPGRISTQNNQGNRIWNPNYGAKY